MQEEIAALGAGLVRDCDYLVRLLEHSNDQIFSGLMRELVKEARQAKMSTYKVLQQMVSVYEHG